MNMTSDQVQQMFIDLMNGDEPDMSGDDAKEIRASLEKEIEEAKKNNTSFDLVDLG